MTGINELLLLRSVEVHQAALGEDGALVLGQVLEVEVQVMHAVGSDNLGINLLLAIDDGLTDAGNEYHVTGVVVELNIGSNGEGNDTPVDAVAAIALGSVLVADVGVTAEHLLARCGLLASGTVTGLVGEYA